MRPNTSDAIGGALFALGNNPIEVAIQKRGLTGEAAQEHREKVTANVAAAKHFLDGFLNEARDAVREDRLPAKRKIEHGDERRMLRKPEGAPPDRMLWGPGEGFSPLVQLEVCKEVLDDIRAIFVKNNIALAVVHAHDGGGMRDWFEV